MPEFTNFATLSYDSITVNSNIVTGNLQAVLTASKTAVMDTYFANDDVTYVVSIVNAGSLPYTGLTLTDDLGAYPFGLLTLYPLTYTVGSITYYINGVLQAAPTVTPGPPLAITGISVPANGNATIIYEVKVNQYAPLTVNGSITNTVTITGGGLTTPVTATETITTVDAPSLTITKLLSPTTVIENGTVTYTFIIENYGNTAAVAGDNVVLTDTFNPILTITSVTFNAATWVSPTNYTYNTGTGAFATVAGQITVGAATFAQNPVTGIWVTTPSISTLVIVGTV